MSGLRLRSYLAFLLPVVYLGCRPARPASNQPPKLTAIAAPQVQPAEESAYQHVFYFETATADAPETWRVARACRMDENFSTDARAAINTATAYLTRSQLLPPTYRFCVTRVADNQWQVTCLPTGQYINSPVVMQVIDGRITNHSFSNAIDGGLRESGELFAPLQEKESGRIHTRRTWDMHKTPSPPHK